jgi:hypothetical protein
MLLVVKTMLLVVKPHFGEKRPHTPASHFGEKTTHTSTPKKTLLGENNPFNR